MDFHSYIITTQLARLKNLLANGTLTNGEVQTEIADLRANLRANGMSDDAIDVHAATDQQAEERRQAQARRDAQALLNRNRA